MQTKDLKLGKAPSNFPMEKYFSELSESIDYLNGMIESKWEIITPEYAFNILTKHNPLNRCLLDGTVNSYAKQMREGKWKANGEAIIFSETKEMVINGVKENTFILLNGQHRLAACAKSGIPFKSLVVRGVPTDAFDSMDTGKVRTGKDALSAAHVFDEYKFSVSDYGLASAIIKKVLEFSEGRKGSHGSSSTRTAPSNADIVNEGFKNIGIYSSIISKLNEWNKTVQVEDWYKSSIRMNGWFMAWLVVACGWSEGDVFMFFREVVDKKHLSENVDSDPIEKLKERIKVHLEKRPKGQKSPYTDLNMFDFYARAWNAYVDGKTLSSMSRRDTTADFIEKSKHKALKSKSAELELAASMAMS